MEKPVIFEILNSSTKKGALEVIGVHQYSDSKIIVPSMETAQALTQGSPKASSKSKGPVGNSWKVYIDALNHSAGHPGAFCAQMGTTYSVRMGGSDAKDHLLFAGLGKTDSSDTPLQLEEGYRVLGGTLWNKFANEKLKLIAFHSESFLAQSSHPEPVRLLRALAEGLSLAAYQFNKYKSGSSRASDQVQIHFICQDAHLRQSMEEHLREVRAMSEAVALTRDWSNEPSNTGTPEYFASEARKIAKAYGLKIRVLGEKECTSEKMGLFLGVGQGSVRESKLVVLEYAPKPEKGKKSGQKTLPRTVALVGKGVTFDSGGISIKPSLKMEAMKHDMTGAASVMGALMIAAKTQSKNKVIGILAFVENMPSGNAIQPGNILKSRSGKTVEVINTDAEGRLILADALDFVQDMKPDVVVDIATLTGAVSVALGKQCSGILGNDDGVVESLRKSASSHGEKLWQLPLYDEYFDDLRSDCADMKNSANDANGGTIRGAIFLKQFIRPNVKWAHLDIAALADSVTHLSYIPKKGASGLFVRTLAQFADDFK